MKHLKVCNVKNIYETRTLGRMEVPFLGYHLISENDFARTETIKRCTSELKNYYKKSKSILVTKEKDIFEIKRLVKEFEFDGVQFHFEDSQSQIKALRTEFENGLIIFQVISPQSNDMSVSPDADYLILDKSFVGGTGTEIGKETAAELISKIDSNKILLAGGINANNIVEYLNLDIQGFDVQSSVKSNNSSSTENIDYNKLLELGSKLGYQDSPIINGVGFVALDINQQNFEITEEALKIGVDLIHLDITEGEIGAKTNFDITNNLIDFIATYNSHIPVQLHMFTTSSNSFEDIIKNININKLQNKGIFLHINRNNYQNFSSDFFINNKVFFGLDVKDIIDDVLEWEDYIKEQTILCLQSPDNPTRLENLNNALKLIQYISPNSTVVTIDRGLDFRITFNLVNGINLNAVYGSNLRADIPNRFYLLKKMLYGI